MPCFHGNQLLSIILSIVFLHLHPQCNAVVLINEVNAHNPGTDNREFIELYNTEEAQVSLDEYTIVLYNGRGRVAYAVVPLNGIIQAHGFYVVGNVRVQPNRNLTDIDGDGFNILQNGPDGVALYQGNRDMFSNGMLVTNTSLVDAIVYDTSNRGRHHRGLISVLAPGERTLHEFRGHIEGEDESISRCDGMEPRKLSQFKLTPLTPGVTNNCTYAVPTEPPTTAVPQSTPPMIGPDRHPNIVINEFSTEEQFVELYDGGVGEVSLDGMTVVFYSGENSAVYGNPISLDGYETDDQGYFLLSQGQSSSGQRSSGSGQMSYPTIVLPNTIASNGINAIALHYMVGNYITDASPLSNMNLVDVVVYAQNGSTNDNDLVRLFSPGQIPLTGLAFGFSWCRCRGWDPVMPQSFQTAPPTPGIDNRCTLPSIVINEVNAAAEENDFDEFIELFDGGVGRQSLDGIIVVLYNGARDAAYRAYDLTGYTTNRHGFAVLGHANHSFVDIPVDMSKNGFLQAGPDAVALHLGPIARFGRGSQPTSANLIDAIIYGTGDDPALSLQHALLPLQPMPNELRGIGDIDHSVSRCVCCQQRQASLWGVGHVSPGEMNVDCTRNQTTVVETLEHYQDIIRINEIHLTRAGLSNGEYLELYDSGLGHVPLDNLAVVIYNGNGDDRSTTLFYLDSYATDDRGYFVIGSSFMTPPPHYSLNTRTTLFPGRSGGVALYKVSANDVPIFSSQSVINRDNLVDAMVFGDITIDFSLLEALAPDSIPITMESIEDETSIVRCFSNDPVDQLAFVVNQSTPSAPNRCPYPPVVLNEINVRAPGDDLGEYIELSSLGVPRFPINDLQVVLWQGNTEKSYKVIKIDGRRTDANGYFLIGYQGLFSPRPDMTEFEVPRGNIKNGPQAVTLHSTIDGKIRENKPLNKRGLMDAAVYYTNQNSIPQNLADFFTPGVDPVFEQNQYSNRDESINRCETDSAGSSWVLAHISPKDHNYCPSRNVKMVINEVSLVTAEQYIELWDNGVGYTTLDDFVVVLFGEDNRSYWTISLAGYMTSSYGYFVMGTANIRPLAQFIFADGFMRTQYGAIGVYRLSEMEALTESSSPSNKGLVDAIVYSEEFAHNPLSNVLTPVSKPIPSSIVQVSGESLSRCFSHQVLSTQAFVIASQTPQRLNNCPILPDDIVINEVNVDQPNDRSKEFIELYDGGVGNKRLEYLTLVLFNGHNGDRSYMTFDLDDYQTNGDGYFVIGSDRLKDDAVDIGINTRQSGSSGGLLQDGPDAIALYRAPAGAFPHRTKATPKSLLDAVVYSTGSEDSHSLIDKLMPGHSMVQEDEEHRRRDESISRCLGMKRLDSSMYRLAKPTPGRRNNCTGERFETAVFINEVNVNSPGPISAEFIELYDGGKGDLSLDDMILVFFNGANQDRSYLEVDLTGERTNSTGYFVIGSGRVNPTPYIIIPDNSMQNGPDAVALYHAGTRHFPRGTVATPTNLIDVVVYGPSTNQDAGLMERLAPSQVQLVESESGDDGDWSLSRCSSNQKVSMMSFSSAPATPGEPNLCSQTRSAIPSVGPETPNILTNLVINEVFFKGTFDQPPFIEFVELKGPPNFPVNNYTLVTVSATTLETILVSNLELSADGIITIATDNMKSAWQPDVLVGEYTFLPRRTGAVALYKDISGIQLLFTDLNRYKDKLIDALVYTDDVTTLSNEWSTLLTPDSNSFYPSDFSSRYGNTSISRCTCCATQTSSVFTLTQPSPGQDNAPLCPSMANSRTIQMRLINGAYDIWSGNTRLVAELKSLIAAGINGNCQCGFNVNYLTDDQILNGSVIYQATMLASSVNQSQLLYDSYVTFIKDVSEVRVQGAVYKVDGNCATDCLGSPSAVKRSGGTKTRGSVVAVVCIIVIVIIVAAIVGVVLLLRQRNLIQYLKEFNDTTRTADGEMKIPGRCSLSHLDIFAQQFRHAGTFQQESFANPLYMSSEDGATGGRDGVTMTTIPEVAAAPQTEITVEVTDTDKESDNNAAVIEVTSANNHDNDVSVNQKNVNEQKEDKREEPDKKEGPEDVNQNEPDVTKDTAKIIEEKKKKKVKKGGKSGRDKASLDRVLKKLRDGDLGAGSAEGNNDHAGKSGDGSRAGGACDQDDLTYRKYVRL